MDRLYDRMARQEAQCGAAVLGEDRAGRRRHRRHHGRRRLPRLAEAFRQRPAGGLRQEPTAASRPSASTSRRNSPAGSRRCWSRRATPSRPARCWRRIDTAELEAQLNDAKATMRQAERQLDQAIALVAQRKSELTLAEPGARSLPGARAKGLHVQGDRRPAALREAHGGGCASIAPMRRSTSPRPPSRRRRRGSTRIQTYIDDSVLTAPRGGRVQYRLALPGEVLAAGGKVLTLLDLTDVYMTVFLPTSEAGRLALGAEARIIFDAAPQYVVPATRLVRRDRKRSSRRSTSRRRASARSSCSASRCSFRARSSKSMPSG